MMAKLNLSNLRLKRTEGGGFFVDVKNPDLLVSSVMVGKGMLSDEQRSELIDKLCEAFNGQDDG